MKDQGKKVAISGASGLLGRRLQPALAAAGWRPLAMVRRPGASAVAEDEIAWDPAAGRLEPADVEGLSAVVHLAGENVFGRWSKAKKARIEQSRVRGTRLIAETLAGLKNPPKVLVSASAIGFYGDRSDDLMDESRQKGDGFLADVCWRWEAATAPAKEAGIRVVNLRIGVVLSKQGGALKQMLTPFRFGVGGRLGSGQQWFSWIHIDDLIAAILFTIGDERLKGAVNGVGPEPVRNIELTKTMGRVLNRPTLLPVPTFALQAIFGEMGDETLLASTRVVPRALEEAGFEFRHRQLESALRRELE